MPVYVEDSYNTQSGGADMELMPQKAENSLGIAGNSLNMHSASISSATLSAGGTFTATSERAGSGAYRGVATQTDYQALSGG